MHMYGVSYHSSDILVWLGWICMHLPGMGSVRVYSCLFLSFFFMQRAYLQDVYTCRHACIDQIIKYIYVYTN